MKKNIILLSIVFLWVNVGYAQKKFTVSAFGGGSYNFFNQAYSSNGFYSPFVAGSTLQPAFGSSLDYIGRNPKCINRLFISTHTISQKVKPHKKNFSQTNSPFVKSTLFSIQAGYNKEWQVWQLPKNKNTILYAGFITSLSYGLDIKLKYNNDTAISKYGDSLYFVGVPNNPKRGLFAMIYIGGTARAVFNNNSGREKYSIGLQFVAGIGRANNFYPLYFYQNYIDQLTISNRAYMCNLFFSIPIFRR